MKRFTALLGVLLLACPAWGQTLTLPEEVKGEPGDYVQVPADTPGKTVQWYAIDPGLKLFPVNLLKDTRTAVVSATKEGRYRLLAYTAAKDLPTPPAVTVVVIGRPKPDPPPGPVPDPEPDDGVSVPAALQQSLDAAYAAEADPSKARRVALYASLLRAAVPTLQKSGVVKTRDDFDGRMRAATDNALGGTIAEGAIPAVRKAVGAWVNTQLPRENAAMDDAFWGKANVACLQVAKALKGVK